MVITGQSYNIGYKRGVEQGYYIADTNLMNTLWGVTSKSGIMTGSFSESLGNFDKIETSGLNFLRQIADNQNAAIMMWFKYLSSIGVIMPQKIDGATIKQYYDMINELGGIANSARGLTKEKSEDQLVKKIAEAKSRFNIPIMIKNEILAMVDKGLIEIASNGHLKFSMAVVQNIVNNVYETITNDILSNNSIINQNQIENIRSRILGALRQDIPLQGILREVIRSNRNKFTISKDRRILRSKGKGLTGLLLDHSELQDFNIAEYVASAIGAGLSGKSTATGKDQTRSIRIWDEVTNDISTKLVSGKDDAIWDFLDQQSSINKINIKVHISTKLYGTRSKKGGKAESSGLSEVQLEGSGKAFLRYQELERLLSRDMDRATYQRLVFGINNLAKDSLLEGAAFKKKYENILAIFFSAFMFNNSMDQLANNFAEGNDTHNIFLFNLNGQFYSLAEICERLIRVGQHGSEGMSSYIKTTITPASSRVGDPVSGTMIIQGQEEAPPFTPAQWERVRLEIENETTFSTTKFDAKKLLNLAGIYE